MKLKYSLVNGERSEAKHKLKGECELCGSPNVARCGIKNIWHWAHKGKLLCDPWWENEFISR